MPQWTQVVVGAGALFAACALLWTKAVKPIIKIAADYDKIEQRIKRIERHLGLKDDDG